MICAASLCFVAVLPGCSAGSPGAGLRSPLGYPTAPSSHGLFTFTVAGVHPVLLNGSQDSMRKRRGPVRQRYVRRRQALGVRVADGFALAGFPASADLLRHFLTGKGTEVDYRAGSLISKKALASGAFRAVNNEVQAAVLSQLKAGRTRLRLSAAQLPAVL